MIKPKTKLTLSLIIFISQLMFVVYATNTDLRYWGFYSWLFTFVVMILIVLPTKK